MSTKILLLLSLLPIFLFGQIKIPPASPSEKATTQIGLTHFEISYSRPSVKGRTIFGALVPYDTIWRTGANASTLLHFDKAIKIEDQRIDAGTYALFTIPREKENWTIILNSDTTLWGANDYDKNKDIIRFEARSRHLSERVESLEFRWMNITDVTVDLAVEWENIRVKLPIQLLTHDQVNEQIREQLVKGAKGSDYYRAANYYLNNDLDLDKAKTWMDKRLKLGGEKFWVLRNKALLEWKMGNYEQARKSMERSLALAKEAENEHYTSMDIQSLQEWTIDTLQITAAEILAKSIQHHDPKNTWQTAKHEFNLYEGRPDGGYRITDITFSQKNEYYSIHQRRDRNLITQTIDKDTVFFKVNGNSNLTEKELKKHRLNPDRSKLIKNYYTYLWGLPMKLTDVGTIFGDVVRVVDFFGKRLIEIKVTYAEEVGDDIWYFYFDPTTYAMSGYRFYHDEKANDGEYILLEDEVKVGSMTIPATRHWYTHKSSRFLGSDELLETKKSEIKEKGNSNYDASLAAELGADDYGMKLFVLVMLKTGTNDSADKMLRDSCFVGHMNNIDRLVKEGKMIVAGPMFKNEKDYRGIFILDVPSLEAAAELLETDPAIHAKLLEPELYLWYGSAALPEYLEASDKVWKIKP